MTDLCRYCFMDTPVQYCRDAAHIRLRTPLPLKRGTPKLVKITTQMPSPISPSARRTARLWELYRITDADYESILSHQAGVCAITGKIPNAHLNIDHCHKTGLIRGLLSAWANKGLSFFNDDPACLEAAARYLRNPPAVSAIGKRYGLLGRAQRKKKMIYGSSAVGGHPKPV